MWKNKTWTVAIKMWTNKTWTNKMWINKMWNKMWIVD